MSKDQIQAQIELLEKYIYQAKYKAQVIYLHRLEGDLEVLRDMTSYK